ncbi:MAG: hypothetical protein E6G97_18185 [Alphaproteobacteria bacterium]|nr:MAG: hypothetical protein E6G97_18185 [Alphaproteobacteria bacterium]
MDALWDKFTEEQRKAVMALDGNEGLPEVIQQAINAYKALYDAGGGRGNDTPRPKVQQDFSPAQLGDLAELSLAFDDARWGLEMALLDRRLASLSLSDRSEAQ